MDEMVDALTTELRQRQDYLGGSKVESIYFGGGTPSLLNEVALQNLLATANDLFEVAPNAEVTLEANPDDLDRVAIQKLVKAGINRLSIGVQSFDADILKWMNRSHNAAQSVAAVRNAQDLGIEELSIDLIYGIPGMSLAMWEEQLHNALELKVPHISSYALTVEHKTILDHQVRKKNLEMPSDTDVQMQFSTMKEQLKKAGYEHYEVSNFALPGHRARHNSSYWSGAAYLGIGPSAHSFDGRSRQWNKANNALYMNGAIKGEIPFEREELSAKDRYNEMVMTGLRLSDGVDLTVLSELLGSSFEEFLRGESAELVEQGKLKLEGQRLFIPEQHRFLTDGIASSLFYI